jgi:curved DNA-binding protein CbpA
MVQKILIALLHALLKLIENIFQSKELPKNEDFSRDQSSNNNDQLEKDAYAFMELEQPATMEQLKKQYKRLSLRYHPDRNSGSQESHEMQQKLNACFDLLQQALEGNIAEEQDDDIPSSSYEEQNMQTEEEEQWEEQWEEQRQHQQHSNDKKSKRHPKQNGKSKHQRKRGNRRQEKQEQRRQQMQRDRDQEYQRGQARRQEKMRQQMQQEMDQMRQQMQREMDEEYQRGQALKLKLQQEQEKIRRETSQSLDAEQRQALSRLFMNRLTENHDDYHHSNNPNVEKPKYYIMEACTRELAVAIRLGMTELVLQLVSEQTDIHVQKNLRALQQQAFLEERNIQATAETLGYAEIRLRIMTQSLDDDGNTILHYAVYWEQPSIIRNLAYMAQHGLVLDRMMLATNVHGHTPSDFAYVAIDPSIVPLMQSQESLAKIYREQTKIGPASVKAGKEFAKIFRNADWATTLNSILGYCVGAWGFRLHSIFCIVGVVILQNFNKDHADKDPYIFEIAMTAYYLMCSVVVHWLYPAMNWWYLLILLLLSGLWCGPLVVLASPLYIFDLIQQVLRLPVEWFRKVLSGRVADDYLSLELRRAAILVDVLIASFFLQVWFSWVKHVDERR